MIHYPRTPMAFCDDRQHHANLRHRCKIDWELRDNFRVLHFVELHDYPVEAFQYCEINSISIISHCYLYFKIFSKVEYYFTYPPLSDQSFCLRSIVGASFCKTAVQNHPLMFNGWRSDLSQPGKSQRRPEVQIYFTLSKKNQSKW